AAGVDADGVLFARPVQVQRPVAVVPGAARALVEHLEMAAMDVEGMRHAGGVVQHEADVLTLLHRDPRGGGVGGGWLRAGTRLWGGRPAPLPRPAERPPRPPRARAPQPVWRRDR